METQPAILYVEDDPMSRKIMEHSLRRFGYPHVSIFPDSEDFMAKVLALVPLPTLVFLDIHVRPVGGFEMLKLLRAHASFADTKVVALTASVMNEEVAKLQVAGFDGCLAKPMDTKTLPDLIDRIMKGERIWRINL